VLVTFGSFVDEKLARLTVETGSGNAGLVWLILFTLAGGRIGPIRGVTATGLARQSGLVRNAVRDALRELRERGYLRVESEGRVPVYFLSPLTKARKG